jgi:hypothetical protein
MVRTARSHCLGHPLVAAGDMRFRGDTSVMQKGASCHVLPDSQNGTPWRRPIFRNAWSHLIGDRRAGAVIHTKHHRAVCRIDQRHAGGKQYWKRENRTDGHVFGRLRRRDTEHGNLDRWIEVKSEEHAEWKHVPGLGNEPEQRSKMHARNPRLFRRTSRSLVS